MQGNLREGAGLKQRWAGSGKLQALYNDGDTLATLEKSANNGFSCAVITVRIMR